MIKLYRTNSAAEVEKLNALTNLVKKKWPSYPGSSRRQKKLDVLECFDRGAQCGGLG